MNRIIKNLFLKISISRCIAELEELDLLYLEGRFDEYFEKWRHFLPALTSQQHLFSNVIPTVEAGYHERIIDIEKSIVQQNSEELHQHSIHLSSLFSNAYAAVHLRPGKTIRKLSFALPVLLILALSAFAYKPLKEKYTTEIGKADLLKNKEEYASRTVSDLLNLKKALQQYFDDNKQYPNTSSTWYGVVSPFGEAKTDWIPGLAPKYIRTLPSDPRKYRQPIEQYMYQSNGKDFKLIAHFPVGVETTIKQHPELADVRRPSWAIGVWSEGAKNW